MKHLITFAATLLSLVGVMLALAVSGGRPAEAMGPQVVTPTPIPAPACVPVWYVVASPNAGESANELYSVDSSAPNDVWAVGYYLGSGQHTEASREPESWQTMHRSHVERIDALSVQHTLIEHWDGARWTIMPSPNVGEDDNHLLAVDVVSGSDVWAVGYYLNSFGVAQTLVERWDGTQWSIIPSPNRGSLTDNELLSVEAVSPDEVWAVGYSIDDAGVGQTLTMRWNGAEWGIVSSPNVGPEGNALRDLAVVSAGDVWAVGFSVDERERLNTLSLHWNGQAWTITPSPGVGSEGSLFTGADAVAANDVWAVGYYKANTGAYRALAEHWDGRAWSAVPVPASSDEDQQFFSVKALSATEVWAVGRAGGYHDATDALVERWDGTRWRVVPTADFGQATFNRFLSVEVISPSDVWAVGIQGGYGYYFVPQTLTEHYTDSSAPCPIEFEDVPRSNPFYASIKYLACRNILSGYRNCVRAGGEGSDESCSLVFAPLADITRGQIAKVVSNAAGFNDDPGPQIFADVSGYDTFYTWINRMTRHGVMGGYACGSLPAERCYPPGNRPYFRPYADSTRGQIAKTLSNAAGFSEAHIGQTFEDVPRTHLFYPWIERLAARGIIGGYPCGRRAEPCVPPLNRPYARPSADVTRGQTSKLVVNTFFPGCTTSMQP